MAGRLIRVLALALGLAALPAAAEEPAPDEIAAGLAALDRQDYRAAGLAFAAGAEAGEADAMFYLGRMHELGLGTQASLGTAAQLYTLGAEAGSALAGNRLGLMYLGGTGVVQDYAYGHELVCTAAEQGLADAQFNCGVLSAEGRGGARDPARAVEWYRLAAAQGHVGAMNMLGLVLMTGTDGVPRDLDAARELFEETAAAGNAVGLYTLGQIYAGGLGVEPDPVSAHVWFNLAAAAGHPQAAAARAEAEARLTAEQVAEAQRRARDWRPGAE